MILITGGLGYLGGRLSRQLLQEGEKVRISTRRAGARLPDILSGCELVEIDLLDTDTVSKAMEGVRVVIHLASMNAQDSARNPEKAISVNGIGTLNLLKSAVKFKIRKFIYFSSIHVYGAPLTGLVDESMIPEPIHPYSISRHLAEDLVIATHKQGQMDCLVVRLSNAIGKPLTPDANCWMLVVHDLCRQAIEEGSLKLSGTGKDFRDFIAMGELTQIVQKLVDYQENYPYRLINVGGRNTCTILTIAEMVVSSCERLLGFQPEIHIPNVEESSQFTENQLLDYNCDRLHSICTWERVDLQQEIDEILEFCQQEFAL